MASDKAREPDAYDDAIARMGNAGFLEASRRLRDERNKSVAERYWPNHDQPASPSTGAQHAQ